MRKNTNQTLLLLWGFLLLLSSCADREKPISEPSEERMWVTFTSSVQREDILTRAVDTQWEAGDAIGVYMKKAGSELTAANQVGDAENRQYVTASSVGNFTPAAGQGIYLPDDGSAVDFVAYYPYRADMDDCIYRVNVAGKRRMADVDLMVADNATAVTSTRQQLTFARQLSALVLHISAGEGVNSLEGLSVTLRGTPTRADYSLATGALTVESASTADVQLTVTVSGSTARAEAVVLPTTATHGASLLISLGGKSYTLSLADGTAFAKGQRRSYTLRLTDSQAVTDDPYKGRPRWFETPVLTAGDDLMYVTHAVPSDASVRNYSMLYDKQYKLAYWVAYPMHRYYIGSAKRTDAWGYDPAIDTKWQPRLSKGFGATNIDRGHQLPSADRTRDTEINRTTFYYSNMTAQVGQGLNQSIWANLEGQVRTWTNQCDTLYVVTGAMITTATDKTVTYVTDNDGQRVAKPKYYFKALAKKKGSTYYTIGFRFDNRQYTGTDFDSYRVTVSSLEEETGFTFFPALSKAVKDKIETSQW